MWKRIWAIFWVAVEVLNAVATVANLATNKSLFGITNWLPIGAIIFFLATFALLLWGYWLIRDRIRKQTTQEQKNIQLDRVILQEGFEFFPSRDMLSKHHALSEVVKSADAIWALWRTGTEAYVTSALRSGHIKRLIMPDIKSPCLEFIALAAEKKPEDFVDEVRKLTKEAIDAKVEIRWFSGLTANSLLIYDPYSDDSLIQVEVIYPYARAKSWSSFRITKREYPQLFGELMEAFDKIWAKSSPPRLE